MGKKTVPIAVQRTQKRKVFITSNDKDIDADPAEDSFKIIPIKNGQNEFFGTNTYTSGKRSVSYQTNIKRAENGQDSAYTTHW